jgi:hypothetical protein
VIARRGPVAAAIVVLMVAVALLRRASAAHTGGALVYALDDAYIHMAVGRNLATHGVWGVTRYAFTSATSSLLWPLLLAAADLAVGVRDATPLVLNLLFAVAALLIADRLLAEARPALRAAALVGLVLLAPLPTLVLAGMEHTLQIAAALWLLERVRAVDGEGAPTPGRLASLAAAAACATAARYESLFLLAPAVVLLAVDGRRRAAIVAAVAGLAPLAAFAAVSLAEGWPPLPNSILLKRATFDGSGASGMIDRLGGHVARTLADAPHLLVLVVAILAFSVLLPAPRIVRRWDAIFAAAVVMHCQLAAVGWLFRYEAYLVAIGIVLVARHLAEARAATAPGPMSRGAAPIVLVLAGVLASAPLLTRAVAALEQTPGAVKNIYEQQYQMGLFARGLPAGSTVMANDIGAICYLADVRLVDLFGLATQETARARRTGGVDRELLARLAAPDPPSAVMVYRSWFADAIPPEWIEVGTWRVPDKIVVADRTVSFYATRPASAEALARSLEKFQPRLPSTVSARLAGPRGP